MNLSDQINALLPQTQCGQCGFKGCKPYSDAILSGAADINQCPPGGDEGIQALSQLLGIQPKPLNPAYGVHKAQQVAFIRETECIGCVKCLAVCPVDAIVGAAKLMHTVIAAECTGCELCLPPCPVNCIDLIPLEIQLSPDQKTEKRLVAKQRYEARVARLALAEQEKAEKIRRQKQALLKFRLDGTNTHPSS